MSVCDKKREERNRENNHIHTHIHTLTHYVVQSAIQTVYTRMACATFQIIIRFKDFFAETVVTDSAITHINNVRQITVAKYAS